MPTEVSHPLFARIYPRINAFTEAHGAVEHRQELLVGIRGRVLEIGAGTGANFWHYPPEVEHVVAVEPEPRLRAQAERAAAEASVPIEVRAGLAEDLPAPDSSVDVVVASLVLCTVGDVPRVLAEAARVLRPAGELRFYEHVKADRTRRARLQRMLDPLWTRVGGGCHLTRDTERAITDAGFAVAHVRRFDFLVNGRTAPSSPTIIGVAHKRLPDTR
ncbi:class I SAM-dependent methyltransferase [Streptomyces sp. H39-C1]|uniref:class I SAM-dependent methyltransferase n=1 Tax=Streptomyces sp. H39-C1 TaxID=3004355 RepID=UPI0022B01431|nr:class I SAM-dependent methyltransferase [Streptomyces sp. H39-C1]MCZ4102790.1 class I SAM-dependent methyltransferase [Streptomyces sp. H39-C1]